MTTRILFVDDDEFLLAAMRRLAWNYDEWECEFADGGPTALETLADQEFDVVVSDMRMPGMDGTALLANVRLLCPETIRIVLSGQSDREYAFHAVGPVQQFLSKPCNAEELKRTIARAMGLEEFLSIGHAETHRIGNETFGGFPSLAARVHNTLEGKDALASSIVAASNLDTGLSELVLSVANSTWKPNSPCQTIDEIVAELGVEAMRPFVFALAIYSQVASDSQSAKEVLKRAARPAFLAREITKIETGSLEMADHAMLGGLLKGLAELILLRGDGSSERDASVVAAMVLRQWGFSLPVVETVAFHQCPHAVIDEGFSPLAAVYAAKHICNGSLESDSSEFFESIGLGDQLSRWTEFAESR